MNNIKLKVNGMHCNGCESRIKNAISQMDGIENVIADHVSGIVEIGCIKDINLKALKEIIEDLGFEVEEN